MVLKLCIRHKQLLPTQFFSKHSGRPDGLNSICKDCDNTARARRYRETAAALCKRLAKERMAERAYRSKHNPFGLRPEDR